MATPRTVAFYTLGCKLNYSETSSIGRLFEDNGYSEIKFEESVKKTNANGDLLLTHVPGTYNYSLRSKGYQNVNGQLIITKDTLIKIVLQPESYNVSLKLMGDMNIPFLNQ